MLLSSTFSLLFFMSLGILIILSRQTFFNLLMIKFLLHFIEPFWNCCEIITAATPRSAEVYTRWFSHSALWVVSLWITKVGHSFINFLVQDSHSVRLLAHYKINKWIDIQSMGLSTPRPTTFMTQAALINKAGGYRYLGIRYINRNYFLKRGNCYFIVNKNWDTSLIKVKQHSMLRNGNILLTSGRTYCSHIWIN